MDNPFRFSAHARAVRSDWVFRMQMYEATMVRYPKVLDDFAEKDRVTVA
jgi:hypothetical protein